MNFCNEGCTGCFYCKEGVSGCGYNPTYDHYIKGTEDYPQIFESCKRAKPLTHFDSGCGCGCGGRCGCYGGMHFKKYVLLILAILIIYYFYNR